jgi:hypothetical protein
MHPSQCVCWPWRVRKFTPPEPILTSRGWGPVLHEQLPVLDKQITWERAQPGMVSVPSLDFPSVVPQRPCALRLLVPTQTSSRAHVKLLWEEFLGETAFERQKNLTVLRWDKELGSRCPRYVT